MASNPMLQAVMLFQHHQTTTPFMPVPMVAREATTRKPGETEGEDDPPPFDEEEEESEEERRKRDNG